MSIVVTATTSYIKGNRAYWAGWADDDEGLPPKLGRRLANRWVKESVESDGDEPGSARRRITVHATAPVLPVRVVQTGRRRAGEARAETCASSMKDTTDRRSEIRLSRFGRIGPVTAPRGAVTVQKALGS